MSDNVIFLAESNPSATAPDTMTFIACASCRNKTYTLTGDVPGELPLLRCAACQRHIGRMGWGEM